MSRAKATTTQLAYLVEFMKTNHDVASGHGTGLQGKLALEQQWKTLSETLNALGGPVKTVEKWKQTWRDLRNGVKKKAIKNKKEQKGDGPGGTGNGPSQIENFTAQDEAVMSVIGPIAIHGMDGVPFTVPAEDSPHTEQIVVPNILEACSEEVVPTSMVVDHVLLAPPTTIAAPPSSPAALRQRVAPLCSTTATTPTLMAATPSSQAPPRRGVRNRRRLTTRTESFDSQILEFEKERLEVQKRQIALDEKKLQLQEKRLLIEEAKVEAFQRIATALEQRSNII